MNINMVIKIIFILVLACNFSYAQNITGRVLNKKNNLPVEYVNIGILGKNIGTVCDNKGYFTITIDSKYDNDTLLFSCIGYNSYYVKVIEFKHKTTKNILLTEKIFELNEVIVKPKIFKQKTLGVTTRTKMAQAGFFENKLGYEAGILMNVKKTALLEQVIINIARCTYDTIFYRLNVYSVNEQKNFENILKQPIYFKLSKEQVKEKIIIDIKKENIIVTGDFLITLEHIRDLGHGGLYFCSSLINKTYYRKTSQGIWETASIGISISVKAQVEK